MCSSSRHTVSYLLSSEFAAIHDFLLKTLASFNDPSKHVKEMTSKLLSIYCTATNNAEYADDSLTKSNFYEPLIELCLSSFIWMDPNIMESAFSLLHHSAQNSTRHCAHIRHYFCDNENMPAIVDFVFKNSLRPAMLNNLWLLMESLLSSKDDPASDDEVQLYLPILAENISQLITSIDSKNNPPTSAIISFAKILICARTHHSETSSNDLLQIGNQFKDALENIIMNFDAKLCQADKSQMEECQLFYNELQRQI
ncbi:hypothetical protein Ddc_08225 [Ditylenchus destructor]|nr:hypothetical protein Ddc_08225 [Ditylenchus destructor]